MKNEELVVREGEPGNLLEVISRAVTDPRMDVGKMRELFQLQREILAEQRRIGFDDAMNRLQDTLPQIPKYGQGKNSKFSKYEDIDVLCRPLWIKEGFNLSFSEKERKDNQVTFQLEVARSGHSKFYELTVHVDEAAQNREGRAIRPAIQDDGSTSSYARRYLISMALNIVSQGEDRDGESLKLITDEQAKDLDALISEVKADKVRFLKFMCVDRLGGIYQRDLTKAIAALEAKRMKGA